MAVEFSLLIIIMKRLFYFTVLTVLAVSLTGCTNSNSNSDNSNVLGKTDNTMQKTTPSPTQVSELKIETLAEGTGTTAKNGDKLTVNYKGSLVDGTQFDSSYDRGTPFTFVLGQGYVIKGWDMGMIGMRVGEKRRLTIPSSLGYGPRGTGPIPGNATLIFEVELLSIN